MQEIMLILITLAGMVGISRHLFSASFVIVIAIRLACSAIRSG